MAKPKEYKVKHTKHLKILGFLQYYSYCFNAVSLNMLVYTVQAT